MVSYVLQGTGANSKEKTRDTRPSLGHRSLLTHMGAVPTSVQNRDTQLSVLRAETILKRKEQFKGNDGGSLGALWLLEKVL